MSSSSATQEMPIPEPMSLQALRSSGEASRRRGNHSSGAEIVRPSASVTIISMSLNATCVASALGLGVLELFIDFPLQVRLIQTGLPQQTRKHSLLESFASMNWNRDATLPVTSVVNMVTALNAEQYPTFSFEGSTELSASDDLQTAISQTSPSGGAGCSSSNPRYASIDSFARSRSSSRVSACVKQPGRAGTSAQYPPSSALWTRIFSVTDLLYEKTD